MLLTRVDGWTAVQASSPALSTEVVSAWARSCPKGWCRSGTCRQRKRPPRHPRVVGVAADDTEDHHDGRRQHGAARDPAQGERRFLAADPQPLARADPSRATYIYANSNPIVYSDPSGRCIPQMSLGAVVGGTGGSAIPGPGTAVGAAGGVVVGLALCLAALAAGTLVINEAVRDQQLGDTIPPVAAPGPMPVPMLGSPPVSPPPHNDFGPEHPDALLFKCSGSQSKTIICTTLAGLVTEAFLDLAANTPGEEIARSNKDNEVRSGPQLPRPSAGHTTLAAAPRRRDPGWHLGPRPRAPRDSIDPGGHRRRRGRGAVDPRGRGRPGPRRHRSGPAAVPRPRWRAGRPVVARGA